MPLKNSSHNEDALRPIKEIRSIFHPKIGNGMPLKWTNIILIFGIHLWAIRSVFLIKYTWTIFLWGKCFHSSYLFI